MHAAGQQQSHAAGTELAAGLHRSVLTAVAASKPAAAVHLSVTVGGPDGACHQQPAGTAACPENWATTARLLASSGTSSAQKDQQQLDAALQGGDSPGHYTLYLLPLQQQQEEAAADAAGAGASSSSSSSLVVGRHRHAWLWYVPASTGQQPQLEQLQGLAVAAAVQALSCCFALHAGPRGLAAAGSLPISPSGQTHLSFSLLNADPGSGSHFTWDMQEWEAAYLTPITASLAPVAAVTAESQVLQYTAARLQGQWSDKHGAYVVKGSQLPFFVDSEWSLESGRAVTPHDSLTHSSSHDARGVAAAGTTAAAAAGRDATALVEPHVLQFVVYVPPQQHRPLQLLGRKGRVRDSNSYVIPSWGGLMVLNPEDANSTASSSRCQHAPASYCPGMAAVELTQEQYQHIASVVIAQLQSLFGVAPATPADSSSSSSGGVGHLAVHQLPAGRLGFTGWQVDALLRQRSAHDVREAARVLAALSTLVQELPNLEMPDLIGEQVCRGKGGLLGC